MAATRPESYTYYGHTYYGYTYYGYTYYGHTYYGYTYYGVLGGDAAGEQAAELATQRGDESVHADETGDEGEAGDEEEFERFTLLRVAAAATGATFTVLLARAIR